MLYDAEPHPETNSIRPERDRAEIALLTAALERDMPVLAICRGSQVLNVALGGDLEQHVPDLVGHEGHKETPGVFSKHPVSVDEGSRLHAVVGDAIEVSSHHHQGYGRLGEGLEVVARADDGTIEALEAGGHAFAVGVLWHPEDGEPASLRGARRRGSQLPQAPLIGPVDVGRLVESLWPEEKTAVEPLGGGITNHNFKVTVGGETLVLRVGGKDTELLGIDRAHEHEAALLAAQLGIGPEVVRFQDGCLVTRFVEGKVGDPCDRDRPPAPSPARRAGVPGSLRRVSRSRDVRRHRA